MAKANLIKTTQAGITAREIDLASQFGKDLTALQNILKISKAIVKEAGTKLVMRRVSVELAQNVGEGEVIPYSEVTFEEVNPSDITLRKAQIGASMESIQKFGYDTAVDRADNGMISSMRSEIVSDLYTTLASGELTATASGFQKKMAKGKAKVSTHFEQISLGITGTAAFVNTDEFYDYLGDATITVQTAFGMQYVQNFLGYDVVFITSQIEYGTVIATPLNNLFLFSIDPASSDFAKAGLVFTTDETGFIGIHIEGAYGTVVSETTAVSGVKLWAEYADGIAVVTETP